MRSCRARLGRSSHPNPPVKQEVPEAFLRIVIHESARRRGISLSRTGKCTPPLPQGVLNLCAGAVSEFPQGTQNLLTVELRLALSEARDEAHPRQCIGF